MKPQGELFFLCYRYFRINICGKIFVAGFCYNAYAVTAGNAFFAALAVLLVLGAVRTLFFLCAEAVSVQQSKMAVINEYLVILF